MCVCLRGGGGGVGGGGMKLKLIYHDVKLAHAHLTGRQFMGQHRISLCKSIFYS